MVRLKIMDTTQTGGTRDIDRCLDRFFVKSGDLTRFLFNYQSTLTPRILGRNTSGTCSRMAAHGLNATDRKHKSTCGISPNTRE
jgi:hypothetical protein